MRKNVYSKNLNSQKNITRKVIKKRHRHKKGKLINYRFRLILTYSFIFCVICIVCFFLSSTVLFKINAIEVQGDNVCDPNVLIEKSGIKNGENLFFAKIDEARIKIEKEIPSIDCVNIKRKIPNKIIIEVKKANRVFNIAYDGLYISTNEKGKVLDISDKQDENLIFLQGIDLESFEIGSKIIYKNASMDKKINEIINLMAAKGLFKINEINFNDEFNIIVNYDNRIKINFGLYENMEYKIRNAAEILNKKIGIGETGVLDVSTVSKENRSYFTPNNKALKPNM